MANIFLEKWIIKLFTFHYCFLKGAVLDSQNIKMIYIFYNLGFLYEYKIVANSDEIIIKKELIKVQDIKEFAIKNDITLIEEEIYHGGGQTILHQSNKTIK
jgi:hypothetical protein